MEGVWGGGVCGGCVEGVWRVCGGGGVWRVCGGQGCHGANP